MAKEIIKISGTIVVLIMTTLAIPLSSWWAFGRFTFNMPKAMEEHKQRLDQEKFDRVKEYCDFDVVGTRYGYECHRPCMKHSLDGKDCVPKGCVGGGLFSRMDCDLYVCEGYGDITPQCLFHYRGSKEDYCKEYPDDKMYCY